MPNAETSFLEDRVESIKASALPKQNLQYSNTKIHFLELDFLRGIAAVGVLWYHLVERIGLPPLFSHGYLGVDFFFVLSGFVLAKAYKERLRNQSLSIYRFLQLRSIRLLPLVMFGTLIGSAVELGRPSVLNQYQHLWDIAVATIMGSFLIPTLFTTTLDFSAFPLDVPIWSLSIEFFASIIFAVWAKLSGRYNHVYVTALISLVIAVYLTKLLGKADFGSMPNDFLLGLVRFSWSFSVGMLIYRFRSIRLEASAFIPLAVLIVVLAIPVYSSINWLYDCVSIVFILPFIVFLATSSKSSNLINRWGSFSGNMSYPLYVVHYSVVRVICNKVNQLELSTGSRILFVLLATFLLIAISHIIHDYADLPIRKHLVKMLPGVRKNEKRLSSSVAG